MPSEGKGHTFEIVSGAPFAHKTANVGVGVLAPRDDLLQGRIEFSYGTLWRLLFDAFTPKECANYLTACGYYDAD